MSVSVSRDSDVLEFIVTHLDQHIHRYLFAIEDVLQTTQADRVEESRHVEILHRNVAFGSVRIGILAAFGRSDGFVEAPNCSGNILVLPEMPLAEKVLIDRLELKLGKIRRPFEKARTNFS